MGTWELQAGMPRDSSKAWELWHFPAAFPTALSLGFARVLPPPFPKMSPSCLFDACGLLVFQENNHNWGFRSIADV